MTHVRSCFIRAVLLGNFLFAGAAAAQAPAYTDLTQAPPGSYALDKTHGYITFSYLHQG